MIFLIILHTLLELLPISSSLFFMLFNVPNKHFLHFFSGVFIFFFYFHKYYKNLLILDKKLFRIIGKILLTTLPTIVVLFLPQLEFQEHFIINIISGIILCFFLLKARFIIPINDLRSFDDIISYKITFLLCSLNFVSYYIPGVSRMGSYLILLSFFNIPLIHSYIYTLICSVPLLIGAGYLEQYLIFAIVKIHYASLLIGGIIMFFVFLKSEKFFYQHLKYLLLFSVGFRIGYSIIGLILKYENTSIKFNSFCKHSLSLFNKSNK